uniref:ShKT domain-containing protein n=1 Tax=Strongyloides stercoralis TaxID=6248 RepID=A0A0K0DTN4_STRER
MWNILKLLSTIIIIILINKVKNENIACLLYSQCEARARYEEQLCVGHEWRKPTFLIPSFPIIMTNKSRCYATLKPEFDAIERLENKLYDEYYKCLIENSNEKEIPKHCNNNYLSNRNYTTTVDSPISCFIGKLRIEQQCGDLKGCCPSITKCSKKRKNSSIIYKLLDLHKQLKSQIAICKISTKNKRRHPNTNKLDYNNQQNNNKINEGRLIIRIGNSLSEFDGDELMSNLKQAPKETNIYVNNNGDVERTNKGKDYGDKIDKKNRISNFEEHKQLTSNYTAQKSSSNSKTVDEYKKESLSSEIGLSIIDEYKNIKNIATDTEDDDLDDLDALSKIIKCPETKDKITTTHIVKDINDKIKDIWFDKKISNKEENNSFEKNSNKTSQNSLNKTLNSKIKISKESKSNVKKTLEEENFKENNIEKDLKHKETIKEKNIIQKSKEDEEEVVKEKNIKENSKQKEVIKEKNLELEEHSNKNSSLYKEQKGEVSDPFLLLLNKFQKINFPKLKNTTEFPPHLEMVTKDTHLTFENVTSKMILTKNDTINIEQFDNKTDDKSFENHKKIYKELTKTNNNNESTDNLKKNSIEYTIYNDNFKNQNLINNTIESNYFFSNNSSKEKKYEDSFKKSEYSNKITSSNNKKEGYGNEYLEKNQIKNKLNEIDGVELMKKEYQNHLQKILLLQNEEEKKLKEKISFFKLNGARKVSHEERGDELIEMTEVESNNKNMHKNDSHIFEEEDSPLKRIAEIVKNCKSRYAGAVKILDENTKPLSLKNSFINWKKTLDERLIKIKEDKTVNVEEFNKFYYKIENETNEISKLFDVYRNNDYDEINDNILFEDNICQPLPYDDNYYNTKTFIDEEDENIVHTINDSNYKKSIENFKKVHSIAYNLRIPNETRFLTSCDYYVKCRSHINLLLDKCSSLIPERPAIPSTESILLSNLNMCGDINMPFFNELYGLYIKRNMNLRSCLKKHDNTNGSTDFCNIKSNNLISTTKEIIKDQDLQLELGKCFSDVNKLQKQCYQMSKCCTEYEGCRKNITNIKDERRMIYLTAKITENNQNCLEKYERKFFKFN